MSSLLGCALKSIVKYDDGGDDETTTGDESDDRGGYGSRVVYNFIICSEGRRMLHLFVSLFERTRRTTQSVNHKGTEETCTSVFYPSCRCPGMYTCLGVTVGQHATSAFHTWRSNDVRLQSCRILDSRRDTVPNGREKGTFPLLAQPT